MVGKQIILGVTDTHPMWTITFMSGNCENLAKNFLK